MELLTAGHGTSDRGELVSLLREAGVEALVDVRRFPGSRRNPDVGRDVMATWLPEAGIGYRWDERLGGRRRLPRDAASPDTWWQHEAFRSYAAHTRTPEFREAMEELAASAQARTTVIMCSESVWWRCHRRLIADVAMLCHDIVVRHLMPNHSTTLHRPSEGARLDDGEVIWDGSVEPDARPCHRP